MTVCILFAHSNISGVYSTGFPNFPSMYYNFTAEDLPLNISVPTKGRKGRMVKVLSFNESVEIVFRAPISWTQRRRIRCTSMVKASTWSAPAWGTSTRSVVLALPLRETLDLGNGNSPHCQGWRFGLNQYSASPGLHASVRR
ncbi:hypothetical protein SAY86_008698 [Trapa natans]|uniref:Uncharacterized protein n=1 Tax=Trapa natans TaxID=22666 RepID=A0AAN7K920_TRANT|nr:hypothetical protein SAY86_008698 [Trapa natans]